MKPIMSALIMAMLATPAMATESDLWSTRRLCEMCTAEKSTGTCITFITGVTSYAIVLGAAGALKTACPPRHTTMEDVKNVFLKYCKEHPEEGPLDGSYSVMNAAFAAYPCKEQPK